MGWIKCVVCEALCGKLSDFVLCELLLGARAGLAPPRPDAILDGCGPLDAARPRPPDSMEALVGHR